MEKFLQHFSVGKNENGISLREIAKWEILSYACTLGTTDMALQYLEQPVNKLVMLVENERLRWYAWVQSTKGSLLWMIEKFQYVLTYQVEPYVEGTIETFTIVNSWLLPLLKLHQCKPKNNTPLLYFTFTYFLHCYWYLFCFVE